MAGRPALRWAVLIFDLEPVTGHEQGGERRGLIVSYEPLHASGVVAVCPITSARDKPARPGEIAIKAGQAGQTKDGLILVHQLRNLSVLRARRMLESSGPVGHLTEPSLRAEVREALAVHLGLDIPGVEDGASQDDYFGPYSR